MKLGDYELRGVTKELTDFKDDLLTILNFGKMPFQVVSEPPTWIANNGETVFYSKGTDRRWYFYTNNAWRSFSFNNQIINAWVVFNGSNSVSILESVNVASITRNSAGDYTINWNGGFSNTNYAVTGFSRPSDFFDNLGVCVAAVDGNPSTSSCRITVKSVAGSGAEDSSYITVIAVGNR